MVEICHQKKVCVGFAVLLAAAMLPVNAVSQRSPARSTWPKQAGVYIASSSEAIPAFPRQLSGFGSEDGMDFLGKTVFCASDDSSFSRQRLAGNTKISEYDERLLFRLLHDSVED